MKKIFTIALCTVIAFTVNAQKKESSSQKFSFGVGPVLAMPTSTGYSFGYGAEVQATYHASENFDAFAQLGFNNFSIKSSFGGGSQGLIPVLVGGRYVSGAFSAGAGIGFGSFTKGGGSGFMYSPQVGYSFDKMQLILTYSGVSVTGGSFGFIGLKGFYNF
ncbi:MAG: hypothetical protein AMXMBFR79_14840 [Chitinophagaceae bacterium]|nr:hypothetical protein [Chitinophagales bacterium]